MPAAAVIRRVQALSGFIGRKEFCRRLLKFLVKSPDSIGDKLEILGGLRKIGGSGIGGVAVKCVDPTKNIKGVGSYLGLF